jgi:hypothetical protein
VEAAADRDDSMTVIQDRRDGLPLPVVACHAVDQ